MVDLNIQIPNGFLEEEIRCDHLITKEMKEIWAVELDLLSELQRVCEKYKIKYFASGGTLLGAVRHKGFIPWDDDIDIEMFREDYMKLCKVGPKEFKHPYLFQNEFTESGSCMGSSKLRNCMTMARYRFEKEKCFRGYNKGIFIDIFPLDNIPDNKDCQIMKKKKIKKYSRLFVTFTDIYFNRVSFYKKRGNNSLFTNIKILLRPLLYYPSKWLKGYTYKKYETACTIGNEEKSNKVAIFQIYNKRTIHDSIDYENSVLLDFEFLKIPAPGNYENWLNNAFGNWHEFIKGGSLHGNGVMVYDTSKPYIES